MGRFTLLDVAQTGTLCRIAVNPPDTDWGKLLVRINRANARMKMPTDCTVN